MWPSRTGVDFWNNFPFFQFLLKKYILLFKIFSRCSVSVFLLLLHREIILPLQIFFSLCSFSFSVLLPLRENKYIHLLRLFSSFCRRTRWSKTPSAFGLVFKASECTLSLFIEGLHITNWKNESLTLPAKCFKVSSVTLVGANCPPTRAINVTKLWKIVSNKSRFPSHFIWYWTESIYAADCFLATQHWQQTLDGGQIVIGEELE